MKLTRAVLPTPLGEMLALASDDGLCALEFTEPADRLTRLEARPSTGSGRLEALERRLQRWFHPHEIVDGDVAIIRRTREWLAAYFAGASADISGVALDMRGAPFEKRVWQSLRSIPPGETTSYGAIAKALGAAGASRAVGAANGANPIAIIVPCHRVIGSSGSLTGYGGGLERKTWLIDHERRWRCEPQASLF